MSLLIEAVLVFLTDLVLMFVVTKTQTNVAAITFKVAGIHISEDESKATTAPAGNQPKLVSALHNNKACTLVFKLHVNILLRFILFAISDSLSSF